MLVRPRLLLRGLEVHGRLLWVAIVTGTRCPYRLRIAQHTRSQGLTYPYVRSTKRTRCREFELRTSSICWISSLLSSCFSLRVSDRLEPRMRCQAVLLLSSQGPLLSVRQVLLQPDQPAASPVDTHHAPASTGAHGNYQCLSSMDMSSLCFLNVWHPSFRFSPKSIKMSQIM